VPVLPAILTSAERARPAVPLVTTPSNDSWSSSYVSGFSASFGRGTDGRSSI